MILKGYFEFSQNIATYMIQVYVLSLTKHVVMNLTRNVISFLFISYKLQYFDDPIPLCYFQVYGSQKDKTNRIFRIIIENTNSISGILDQQASNINCVMLQGSLFYKHNPLQVYRQLIHLKINLKQYSFLFDTGLVCYCMEEMKKCYTNQLGPIYPGQALAVNLCVNHRVKSKLPIKNLVISTKMFDERLPGSHCKIPFWNIKLNWITRNCTKLNYTILSNNEEQCELFLNAIEYKHITIFYIQFLPCPMGFSFDLNRERCECDLSMQSKLLTIINCHTNDQTILRPANSWITADTYNNSHTYHISPNCPF